MVKKACKFGKIVLLSFCFLVPSSSGLGHRPLTAVTRVRTSLGSPIQMAVGKTAAFSFISKAFIKFECLFFLFLVGSTSNLGARSKKVS